MRYLIYLLTIAFVDCSNKFSVIDKNINKEEPKEVNVCPFILFENLDGLESENKDKINFSLSDSTKNCFEVQGISFRKFKLKLISSDYLETSFFIGRKKDSVFTTSEFNPISSLKFLFSTKDINNLPYRLTNTFLPPRDMVIDSMYNFNNKRIYRIDCFYNMANRKTLPYFIDKLYFSLDNGIIKIDVKDNRNNLFTSPL